MRAPIVIISCGAVKRDVECEASQMYMGNYFRGAYATAGAIAPGRVWILSAKYGLLRPWDRIAPYDLRLGDEGSVTAGQLARQAQVQGLTRWPVIALCGARYADLISEVWADVERPLAGLGIGQQRHLMARIRISGYQSTAGV